MPLTLSGTYGVSGIDGSNTTPAVRGGTSSSNGVFYGTNTVSIATNSTTAVTVDSSQNVGVGTSSPGYKVDIGNSSGQVVCRINGGGTNANDGAALYFANSSTYGTYGSIGAYSAILGGAFDRSFTMYSGLSLVLATNGAERARIDTSGRLLINNTSSITNSWLQATADLTLNNCIGLKDTATSYSTGSTYVVFSNSSNATAGSIQHTAVTTVAYNTSSDIRLKHNITYSKDALNIISEIPVRSYNWKEDGKHVDFGFVAQELYPHFPDAVCVGDDTPEIVDPKGTWQVDYGKITPLLVKAIQELSAKNDALEARIAALEAK